VYTKGPKEEKPQVAEKAKGGLESEMWVLKLMNHLKRHLQRNTSGTQRKGQRNCFCE